MSLLETIPYTEYQSALSFTVEQCETIAKLADIRNVRFDGPKKPGEVLMKHLHRRDISVQQYRELIKALPKTSVYYRPRSKVAILIGNEKYLHLSKLATPSVDCNTLASRLKGLGFIVVTLMNTSSSVLKRVLVKLFAAIPEDSYCFIFYAGHGCELCNVKCMLSVDCPAEDVTSDFFVTENFILREVAKCKPDLCVLLMDMCRVYLDRNDPKLYNQIQDTGDYTIHKNLLIGYSTLSAHSAYEVVQIECSQTIDINDTYELRSRDIVVEGASQYAGALCGHLTDDLDVSSLLDKVHEEVENAPKKQRPIKLQCGVAKRSLHDPVSGDVDKLLANIQVISKEFGDENTYYAIESSVEF